MLDKERTNISYHICVCICCCVDLICVDVCVVVMCVVCLCCDVWVISNVFSAAGVWWC